MKEILAAKPSITQLEIDYVSDAVKNGWGKECYGYINRFKEITKNYFGVKHVWPTSSCHGALHIALMALGIGQDDEVIVPDITWASGTVFPVTWLGAKPVFVDVLEETWCIDPNEIEKSITAKTKAIIVVHLYGNLVDMKKVVEIAKKYNLPVIEDAAEGFGSEYHGKKAGSIADIGIFSFHGTKTLTTGEGGLLISNRDDLSSKISTIENQGRRLGSKLFWCDEIGLKYKMSNIQAALGVAQFERADELVNKKREVFCWYKNALEDLPDIQMNAELFNTKNSYWQPTIIFGESWDMTEDKRNKLIENVNKKGVGIRPFFYPVSTMPMYRSSIYCIVSNSIYSRGVNLPSYFDMSRGDALFVVKTIEENLNQPIINYKEIQEKLAKSDQH